MGCSLDTNKVCRDLPIAESTGGLVAGEVDAVGWEVALDDGLDIVIVARVHDRVPKHYHSGHGWCACIRIFLVSLSFAKIEEEGGCECKSSDKQPHL